MSLTIFSCAYQLTLERILLLLVISILHFSQPSKPSVAKFQDMLSVAGFSQLVMQSTHRSGHLLDLVITNSSMISDVVTADFAVSDHLAVLFSIHKPTKGKLKERIQVRKFKNICIDDFRADLSVNMHESLTALTLTSALVKYNTVLKSTLNKHAPLQTKTVCRSHTEPWLTETIRTERRERRKVERKWRSTKLELHRELYVIQRNKVNQLIIEAKRAYFNKKIRDSPNASKDIFKIINKLTSQDSNKTLPTHISDSQLARDFLSFFTEKVKSIRNAVSNTAASPPEEPTHRLDTELFSFTEVNLQCVKDIAVKVPIHYV